MKLNEEEKKIFEDFLVFYNFIQRGVLDITRRRYDAV